MYAAPTPSSSTSRPSLLTRVFEPAATSKGKSEGGWDSIHVFEVVDRGRVAHYKLTSTVILHLGARGDELGELHLGGNLTRQVEQDMPVETDGSHIVNIGRMVEDMEIKIRNLTRQYEHDLENGGTDCIAEEVYFGKARDIVGDLRSIAHTVPVIFRSRLTLQGIAPLTQKSKDTATQREMLSEWNKKNPGQ